MTGKQTAFDRASNVQVPEIVEDEDEEVRSALVPRAIFTRDASDDLSKIPVSTLRLAQGTTPEVTERKASIGQYVLTNFPAYDQVIIVPLGAVDIRVYKTDPKKPPLCQAPTGDYGFGNPGGVCEECPLSKWGEFNPDTGKSAPPPCKEGVMVRSYSITHRCMVDFQFLAGERNKGGFIRQQSLSYGWSNFAVKLTSTPKSNNRGAWYVPQLEMLNEVPEDQREIAARWYEIFLSSQQATREEAIHQLTGRTA